MFEGVQRHQSLSDGIIYKPAVDERFGGGLQARQGMEFLFSALPKGVRSCNGISRRTRNAPGTASDARSRLVVYSRREWGTGDHGQTRAAELGEAAGLPVPSAGLEGSGARLGQQDLHLGAFLKEKGHLGGVCAPPYFQYYNPCDLQQLLGRTY